MLQKTTDKSWLDHSGQSVPIDYITAEDKRKERTVSKLLKKALAMNKALAAFKKEAFADVDKIYGEMLVQANIKSTTRKGNFTMYNFDKSVKIEVNVSDRIEFDENINFAQIKINEFLAEKTEGIDYDISIIANRAFKTTRGSLDTKKVLDLFSYKINHPKWVEAMELIKKSISVNSSVRYMTFYQRGVNDRYEIVNLNYSNI
jgi:hypothetical protein